MWTFLLIGVPLLAALALWFTVWAEKRIDAPVAVPPSPEGAEPGSLAYVLIQAAPGHAQNVASHAVSLPWVQETGIVQGPYDVIVRVTAGSPADAHAELARLSGVLRVLPCRLSVPVAAPAAAPARKIVLPEAEPATPQQIPAPSLAAAEPAGDQRRSA